MKRVIVCFVALSIVLSAAACGRKGELIRPSEIQQKEQRKKEKQARGLL